MIVVAVRRHGERNPGKPRRHLYTEAKHRVPKNGTAGLGGSEHTGAGAAAMDADGRSAGPLRLDPTRRLDAQIRRDGGVQTRSLDPSVRSAHPQNCDSTPGRHAAVPARPASYALIDLFTPLAHPTSLWPAWPGGMSRISPTAATGSNQYRFSPWEGKKGSHQEPQTPLFRHPTDRYTRPGASDAKRTAVVRHVRDKLLRRGGGVEGQNLIMVRAAAIRLTVIWDGVAEERGRAVGAGGTGRCSVACGRHGRPNRGWRAVFHYIGKGAQIMCS